MLRFILNKYFCKVLFSDVFVVGIMKEFVDFVPAPDQIVQLYEKLDRGESLGWCSWFFDN